jgi:hypothetical protein
MDGLMDYELAQSSQPSILGECHGPSEQADSFQLEEVLKKLSPGDASIVRSLYTSIDGSGTAHASNLSQCSSSIPPTKQALPHVQKQQQTRSAVRGTRPQSSLRPAFRNLYSFDGSRVFIARKIRSLGWNASLLMEAYFSQYGTVECFFSSPSRHKKVRLRPAAVAFVVMRNADEVAAILSQSADHVISGVKVYVSSYELQNRREKRFVKSEDSRCLG